MKIRHSPLMLVFWVILASAASAQTPTVTTDVPVESFVGEQFCYTATLTNVGNPGFNPYLRLILAPNLIFDAATFIGSPVNDTSVGTFPAAPGNTLDDPLTNTTITGPEGGTFTILQPPVGSLVESAPPLDIDICITIDPAATVGLPHDVTTVPIYELGDTATGENGPIEGTAVTQPVSPTVVILTKAETAPESERPPGPSHPYTYRLTADIANAQTVDNLVFTDTLPAPIQYLGPTTITGGTGCSVTTEPSVSTPGGNLVVVCTSATGTTSNTDVVISYPVHIIDMLDETFCDTSNLVNTATLDADFNAAALPQATDNQTVMAEHVSIQKGASPTLASPGDTVTYTINFQVTDFGTTTALVMTDLVPDGMSFNSGTVTLNIGGAVPITPNVTPNADGTTTVVYDIGAAAGNLSPGTTGTLTYTTTMLQMTVTPPEPIRAGDNLTNPIDVVYNLLEGATSCSDNSGATVQVEEIVVQKSIVNPQAAYVPGELVTFRLEMQIPSGDTRSIVFEDFFPLPIFDVTTIDTANFGPGFDIRLAPSDTLGFTPVSVTANAAANSLNIQWPDVDTISPQVLAVDIDIVVETAPFADNLFLANLLQVSKADTPGEVFTALPLIQLAIRAPDLVITQGVSASSNPNSAITPPPSNLPVSGDVSDADAGDTLTYVMTVENIGGAQAFDVTVTDVVPAGLIGCAVASVTEGDAVTPRAFTGDLFGAGLVLTNPLSANDDNPRAAARRMRMIPP